LLLLEFDIFLITHEQLHKVGVPPSAYLAAAVGIRTTMSTRRENTPACAAYNRALDPGNYGYHPSLAAGVVFSTIFGLIAIGHLVIVMRTRVYWIVLFSIGATIETIGWVGRAIGYHCPYSRSLFLMQTATLIMGE